MKAKTKKQKTNQKLHNWQKLVCLKKIQGKNLFFSRYYVTFQVGVFFLCFSSIVFLRAILNFHYLEKLLELGPLYFSGLISGTPALRSEFQVNKILKDAWKSLKYLKLWSLTTVLEDCRKPQFYRVETDFFFYSFSYTKHTIIFKTV